MQWSALVLAGGIAGGGLFTAPAHAQQVQVSPANRTISVTSTDEAERKADRASLHVGFRIYGATSDEAYAQAAKLSNTIAGALAGAGVARDAIESESQSVQPVQPYENNGQQTPDERQNRKFEAQQSWTVKTTPEAVAKVLAAAVQAGANNSGNVDWSVSDEDSLTAEAGVKALSRAKTIAAQMAAGLDAKIGNLLYASNQVEVARPMPMMRMGAMAKTADAPPQLSLSAPMISRSATVSAIFAIQ